MPTNQVTFQATLEDNVSPNLSKLEKQLKQAGASPIQIKMVLDAVDKATPKIKQAQQQVDKLPKTHTINLDFKGAFDKFREEMSHIKQELFKPIKVPFDFVDQDGNKAKDAMTKLFNVRERIAVPLMGSMPGSNLLYGVGAGAGIAGAITGLSGVMQESFKQNEEIEQAHQKLAVALRDNSGASTELQKVIAANVKSPFTFQSTVQADVLARSYQLPVFGGENKNVPGGYLKTAGNMAAAMGTSPDDAMQAIAMARQHMFRRLQQFGIRMTAQDFGPSGRFAGMSVDQALGVATRRFQGAMDAQMKTFSGMASNIKDVVSAQIMRPVGQGVFHAIEGSTGHIEKGLQDGSTQKKIGEAVEKIQHLTVQVIQDLQKIHQYFDVHLKKPIEDIVSALTKLGKSFGQAFGGTTSVLIKTFSEALMSITTPLASISKSVPVFAQVFGYMKGMQMMGMGGMVKPLQTLQNAFNPNSSQGIFTGMIKSLMQLPGMLIKLGGFMAFKGIIDAHKASMDMNNQFKDMHGHLDGINQRVALMAAKLGQSETHMKNLVASAAQGIPEGHMAPKARANLALNTAQAGFQLSGITGWSASGIVRAIENDEKSVNQYSVTAMRKFGSELVQAAAVAKKFGVDLNTSMQIMQTFAQQAGPIGLGGLHGLSSVIPLSVGTNKYGVTPGQQAKGLYTPDAVLQQLMTQYKEPSIQDLRKIPGGQLGKYWDFKYNSGGVYSAGKDERTFQQQATAAQALQQSTRGNIGQIAPSALHGQFGIPEVPVLWNQQGLATNFGMFSKQGKSPEQVAEKVKTAWSDTVNNYNRAVQTISAYQAKVDQTQNTLDQYNQAQESVNLQVQAFQHQIQIQQRGVEDASLALQKYTFENLRPLERQLTRVQHVMDTVNHTMSDAQYNMTKFADGLLQGEQAALNQLHALSLYNEQLNYLKMQYTQIGAQLGTRVYERGYSARVQPLMGLSLEMQQQQLQRKQQMAQSQYDITYGEGHYQMQQAQRSLWQKTEMPLNQRLGGIKQNQGVIDRATIQAHNLSEVQFALQNKMFKVNEVIADQQDHLSKLQMNLQEMQQSKTMRNLEDEQFNLGQAIGRTNIQLNQQNKILSQWQNTLDDLNQKKQDLQTLFDSLLQFNTKGGGQFKEVKRMISEGVKTGLIPRGEGDYLLKQVDTAQKTAQHAQKQSEKWWERRASTVDVIRQGVWGFFTGDLWRKIADTVRHVPGVGGVLAGASNIMGTVMPVLTLVATSLAFGGAATWAFKRMLSAFMPDFAKSAIASGAGGLGRALERTRIPGARGMGARLSEIGTVEGLTKALTGGGFIRSILSKFQPLLHPLEHFRTGIGRAGGAALGLALTGNPLIAMLTGAAGSKIAKATGGKEIVNAARDIKQGGHAFANSVKENGRTVRRAASSTNSFVKGNKRNVDEAKRTTDHGQKIQNQHGRQVNEHGRQVNRFRNQIGKLGSHVGGFGKGIGKFASAVGILATAAQLFGDNIGALIKGIGHLFGINIPHTSDPHAPHAGAGDANKLEKSHKNIKQHVKDTGEALRNNIRHYLANHAVANRIANAATKAWHATNMSGNAVSGAIKDWSKTSGFSESVKNHVNKAAQHAGTLLKLLNKAAMVFGAFQIGKDISKGNWGGAAANAAYFAPVTGEMLMGRDILKMFGIDLQLFNKGPSKKHVMDVIKKSFSNLSWWDQHVQSPQGLSHNLSGLDPLGAGLPGARGQASRAGFQQLKNAQNASQLFSASSRAAVGAANRGDFKTAGRYYSAAKKAANDYYYWLKRAQDNNNKALGRSQQGGYNAQLSRQQRFNKQFNERFNASFNRRWLWNRYWNGKFNHDFNVQFEKKWKWNKEWNERFNKQYNDHFNRVWKFNEDFNKRFNQQFNDNFNKQFNERWKQHQKTIEVQKQFHQLSFNQALTFAKLDSQQRQTAFSDALTGPKGLKNYLDSIGSGLNNHWNQRLQLTADSYNKENQIHNDGFKGISETTSSWLVALDKQISTWSKDNNLPLTKGHSTNNIKNIIGNLGASVAAAASSIKPTYRSSYASGGLVEADHHKHRLGVGKTVKMVEEGHPEMVIPLAPHRRERAKGLVKQAHSMLGMAAGGYVYPFVSGATIGRTDQGIDVNMPVGSPIGPMGDARVTGVSPDWYAGQPFLWWQLMNGPRAGKYAYVAEQISNLAAVGSIVKANEAVAKYAASGTGIEYGWATASGQTLAKATTGYHEGQVTPAGSDIRAFIAGLAHGQIVGGNLGAGGAAIPPIHLKKVPEILKKMGIIGGKQHDIAEIHRKKWEKFLNDKASGGTGSLGPGGWVRIGATLDATSAGAQAHPEFFNSGMSFAELGATPGYPNYVGGILEKALGLPPAQYGLPFGQALGIRMPGGNKQFKITKSDIGSGQAGNLHYGIDLHGAIMGALGWTPNQDVEVKKLLGGIPRVPRDNYPALLHRDEMVVPASMAQAARTEAGRGTNLLSTLQHPPKPGSGLTLDQGWLRFFEKFIKLHNSIASIEYDIHKVRRRLETEDKTQAAKQRDTDLLARLNARLRAANATQMRTTTAFNKAIAKNLRAIHDPSAGEDTVAGVQREQHIRKRIIAGVGDPRIAKAIQQLHKHQAEYHKLFLKAHAKGHHESQAERKHLKQLLNLIHKDQAHIAKLRKEDRRLGPARYVVGAAERGVNAALMRAITGSVLNRAQLAAYKRLEVATSGGHKATAAQIRRLERALMRAMTNSTNKVVQQHKNHQKTTRGVHHAVTEGAGKTSKGIHDVHDKVRMVHNAIGISIAHADRSHARLQMHHTRQQNHMDKVEQHHRKLEDRLDKLIAKETSVHISNHAYGATLHTRSRSPRVRSR